MNESHFGTHRGRSAAGGPAALGGLAVPHGLLLGHGGTLAVVLGLGRRERRLGLLRLPETTGTTSAAEITGLGHSIPFRSRCFATPHARDSSRPRRRADAVAALDGPPTFSPRPA